jgi:hypothetical protein
MTNVVDAPPVRAMRSGTEAAPGPATPAAGTDAAFANGRYQVALLEATVRVDGVDFRGALAEVDRLVTELGRVPGYRAEVVESPLDMRPAVAVQGKLGARAADSSEARFTVRVVRERAAP